MEKVLKNKLNQTIHEKIMGECWHEFGEGYYNPYSGRMTGHCSKCKAVYPVNKEHPDYLHDPAAYWKLLQKVKDHERWLPFVYKILWPISLSDAFDIILDQQRGCEAMLDFFVPNWRE